MKQSTKGRAVLMGGLVAGIGPLVPFLNLTCCLIPLAGGLLAAALARRPDQEALSRSDGLIIGALAGLAGTAIYALLVVPPMLWLGDAAGDFLNRLLPALPELPEEIRPVAAVFLDNLGAWIGIYLLFRVMVRLGMSLIFGMLGGILGTLLLEPRATRASS